MNETTTLMLEGKAGIGKAIDIFEKDSFYESKFLVMVTYQDDPLTGEKEIFHQNDCCFYMIDESASS